MAPTYPLASGSFEPYERHYFAETPSFDGGTNTVVITNIAGQRQRNVDKHSSCQSRHGGNVGRKRVWRMQPSGDLNERIRDCRRTISIHRRHRHRIYCSMGPVFNHERGNRLIPSPITQHAISATNVQWSWSQWRLDRWSRARIYSPSSTVYRVGIVDKFSGIDYSVTTQPNLTNVTAIACGTAFDMALSNGTVVAWGDNSAMVRPACLRYLLVTSLRLLPAHGYHGMALQSNGMVVTWGTVPGNWGR